LNPEIRRALLIQIQGFRGRDRRQKTAPPCPQLRRGAAQRKPTDPPTGGPSPPPVHRAFAFAKSQTRPPPTPTWCRLLSSFFFIFFLCFTKKVVSKGFYCNSFYPKKNRQKSKNCLFFSVLFNHVFGRFSVRGVQKHDRQYRFFLPATTSLGTFFFFLASEEPTNHLRDHVK
jgi:hypothetical protein